MSLQPRQPRDVLTIRLDAEGRGVGEWISRHVPFGRAPTWDSALRVESATVIYGSDKGICSFLMTATNFGCTADAMRACIDELPKLADADLFTDAKLTVSCW